MDPRQQLKERGYCVVEVTPERRLVGSTISSQYTIIGLCLNGNVEYEMNLETVKASAGVRFAFTHISMLTTLSMSSDFKSVILVMDDSFALESSVGLDSELLQVVFRTPMRKVDDQREWNMLLTLMSGLNQYQHFPMTSHEMQISGSLFRDILLILSEKEVQGPVRRFYSVTDNYFRNFIALLNDHVKEEHEVAFYASKLNITAKYLGEICKTKSGRKAKEIISAVLIAQLKHEIALSGKSMKVLAYEFGFSDQSSLGKFFRKMTGISPLIFKKQCAGIDVSGIA